jgi:hypothetical protein
MHAVVVLAHQHGIRVGQSDSQIGCTLIATALDAAVRLTIARIPVVLGLVLSIKRGTAFWR